MAKKENIRCSSFDQEIISVLETRVGIKNNFTLWQRDKSGHITFQIKGTLISLTDAGNVIFQLPEDVSVATLDSNIFVAASSGEAIFKTKVSKIENCFLHASFPLEMKYEDRRTSLRKKPKRNEHLDFEITYTRKNSIDGCMTHTVISEVIDYSSGGACICLSKQAISEINQDVAIVIKSLTPKIDLSTQSALIVSSRQFRGMSMGHEELYAIGIMYL